MSSIIITGANGGLGSVVTGQLVSEGIDVFAVYGKSGPGTLQETKGLKLAKLDLYNEEAAASYVKQILEISPGLDAAVLLVGGFAMGKLEDTSREVLEQMIELNFYSAYHVVRPLLKHFLQRENGGRFILIGSRPGLESAAGKDFFAYSLSKSMIFKMAELINAEGKGKNVDAIVFVPSTIDTQANRKAMPEADFSKWVTTEAIAKTISFYLSPEGRMIREGVVKLYNRA